MPTRVDNLADQQRHIHYGVVVRHTLSQSINDSTLTALAFNTDVYNPFNMHSTSVNASRLVAPADGIYAILGTVRWEANATGIRDMGPRVNGAGSRLGLDSLVNLSATQTPYHNYFGLTALRKGDYVEMMVTQTSTGALNALSDGDVAPRFMMVWIGPVNQPFDQKGFVDQPLIDFALETHPAVIVRNSLSQAIVDSTNTALTFNTDVYNPSGMHSTVSNTSRLVAPQTGLYLAIGIVRWDNNATGTRYLGLQVNGAGNSWGLDRLVSLDATETPYHITGNLFKLSQGDYVECVVQQNSGGNLNSQVNADIVPRFMMSWVGP